MSYPIKIAECRTAKSLPYPILHVLSRSIESHTPFKSNSYIHASTSILSYIHTFMRAPAYAQHQSTHDCINRPESVPTMTLRLSPQSFQVASSNKQTTWNLSLVSSLVSIWSRGVTNHVSSGKFKQTNNLKPFKGVIPSMASSEMSPIKWQGTNFNQRTTRIYLISNDEF